MLHNNLLATIGTFTIALFWLRINNYLAHHGIVSSAISRKLIHIGTGPLYVICWLFFDDTEISRWLAALVPLAITGQFLLVGTGVIRDDTAVKAMSRTGDRREILYGPLFYGIIFVIITLIYWKGSPIGMVALMLMCGGDGLADIVGRQWGSVKIPYNHNKSWVGSIGMFFGGWILALVVLSIYVAAGIFDGPVWDRLPAITIIALGATLVETLPFKDIDNITVTAIAIGLGHIIL